MSPDFPRRESSDTEHSACDDRYVTTFYYLDTFINDNGSDQAFSIVICYPRTSRGLTTTAADRTQTAQASGMEQLGNVANIYNMSFG